MKPMCLEVYHNNALEAQTLIHVMQYAQNSKKIVLHFTLTFLDLDSLLAFLGFLWWDGHDYARFIDFFYTLLMSFCNTSEEPMW